MYAQTNIQLFNQLVNDGYATTELTCIRNAYELAMHLFTGRFQASGKMFLAHVVGTASILGSLHLPTAVVAVGLIHNVYMQGDFGDWKNGITDAKRKYIRDAVGKDAEEYAYRFNSLVRGKSQFVRASYDYLENLSPIERNLTLIILADLLEQHLDFGVLYYGNVEERLDFIKNDGHIMIETAEKLGFPTLAANLEAAFKETVLADIPVELRNTNGLSHSFVIAPQSHCRRLSIKVFRELDRRLRYSHHPLASSLRRLYSILRARGKSRS